MAKKSPSIQAQFFQFNHVHTQERQTQRLTYKSQSEYFKIIVQKKLLSLTLFTVITADVKETNTQTLIPVNICK